MEAYIFFFILSVIAIIVIFLLPKSPKTLFLQGDENFFLTEVIKKIKKSKPKEKLDHYVKKILENILQEKIEGCKEYGNRKEGGPVRRPPGGAGAVEFAVEEPEGHARVEVDEQYTEGKRLQPDAGGD